MKNRIKVLGTVLMFFCFFGNINAQVGNCNTELNLNTTEENISGITEKYKASFLTASIQITDNSDIEFWGFSGVLLEDGFSIEEGSTLFATSDCESSTGNLPLTENMRITPNPTSNNASVEIDLDAATDLQLSLINPFGQVIKTFGDAQQIGIGLNTFTIDMSELPAGMYIVQATDGKRISSRRVVKQ